MKLTKKEVQEIADNYRLGKVEWCKLIDKGLVNYNYDVKSYSGEFIIRVLNHRIDKYKKTSLKLEFQVLDYLNKNNFPYKIPSPIKNKYGNYISKFREKTLWIYKKIPGQSMEWSTDTKKIKELAKALSIYHKFVQHIKQKREEERAYWLFKKYKKMWNIKPKDKTDRLMLNNLGFFETALKEALGYKIKGPFLPNHRDFHFSNMLCNKGKIIAILDFDNIRYSPRIMDVVYSVRFTCTEGMNLNKHKLRIFLKEYEKRIKLTRNEKDVIIPLLIEANSVSFWWYYEEMKKAKRLRYKFLKEVTERTKNLVKMIKDYI